jgi:Uma2 family endonuclease
MGDAGVFQEEFRTKHVELIDGDILDKDSSEEPPPRVQFDREQYYLMADAGLFCDRRVELIDGEIMDMSPQRDRHTAATLLVQQALQRALPNFLVRTQMPLSLGKSEPEPDISVVAGQPRDYVGTGHPKSALLIVEVSDSTLPYDRSVKVRMYAQSGIKDYWILNLVDKCLEVMREPAEDAGAALGWRYASVVTVRVGENVSPLAKGESKIAVADLLP